MSHSRLAGCCGLTLVVLTCCLLVPCLFEIRDGEGWVRSANSLNRIGLALNLYHHINGRLPPAVVHAPDGRALYSWRVLLLPYLEEDALYKEFHLDEPWDSPHNKPLTEKTPRCYVPALGGDDPPGLTRYQVFIGPGTAFERDGLRLTWDDFPDGLGGTILAAEAGNPVPWAKPEDLQYDPQKPFPALGGVFGKPVHFLCYELWRRPGFVACFADGSVRFIPSKTDDKTIRGLITRNGGEAVDVTKIE